MAGEFFDAGRARRVRHHVTVYDAIGVYRQHGAVVGAATFARLRLRRDAFERVSDRVGGRGHARRSIARHAENVANRRANLPDRRLVRRHRNARRQHGRLRQKVRTETTFLTHFDSCLFFFCSFNTLLRNQSTETAVTFVYLPTTPADNERVHWYFNSLEMVSRDLPPTIFVHGVNMVTSTTL